MDSIHVPDYWDFCAPGEQYLAHWCSAPGVVGVRTQCAWDSSFGGCTRQDSYYGEGFPWMDAWFYRDDPTHGVLEVADLAPKTAWADRVLLAGYAQRSMVYAPGLEIRWGGTERVCTTVQTPIRIDHARSAYLPPFPGPWSRGTQTCVYEARLDTFVDCLGRTHADVLVMRNAQPWGRVGSSDKSCSGCRYWLARGVGRIAVQWLEYGSDGETVVSAQPQQAAVYAGSITLP